MTLINLCRKENITNHEEDHGGFGLGTLLERFGWLGDTHDRINKYKLTVAK